MTETTASEIVQAYHRAWTGGDVERAMTFVADDVRCQAPGQDLVGKEEYAAFLAGFAPRLTGIADIATFAEGDRVALFYYPQTAVTQTTPAAECFTVRDGKIVDSVLIFDRMSYAPPPA
jgi:ketosteroid isomerase-like protein